MTAAAAALRILGQGGYKNIRFDHAEEDRDEYRSWEKGDYSVIGMDFSDVVDTKTTQMAGERSKTPPDQSQNLEHLARIFSIGVAVFIVGIVFLITTAISPNRYLQLIAWLIMLIGAAMAALSLLRAQDLSRRGAGDSATPSMVR